jgi:hypothetical protein
MMPRGNRTSADFGPTCHIGRFRAKCAVNALIHLEKSDGTRVKKLSIIHRIGSISLVSIDKIKKNERADSSDAHVRQREVPGML